MAEGEGTVPFGINDLGEPCLVAIFVSLSSTDCAMASCVHPLWRSILRNNDAIWANHLHHVFDTDQPSLPNGVPAPSSREAFAAWQEHYSDLVGPSLSGFIGAWNIIKAWLRDHFPEVLETLRPGASRELMREAELALGREMPPAVHMLYRLVNGQDLQYDQSEDDLTAGQHPSYHPSIFHGLFGGYSFYYHCVNVRLLPVERAVAFTKRLQEAGFLSPELLLLGHSCRLDDKQLLLDLDTGAVLLGGMPPGLYGQPSPMTCLPAAPLEGEGGPPLLRWLSEYGRRLRAGWYEVTDALPDTVPRGYSRAINLYPACPPGLATAITRGVRVCTSTVYVPERSRPNHHFFSYSVRICLLTQEQQQQEAVAAAAAAAVAGGGGPSPQQQQQQQGGTSSSSGNRGEGTTAGVAAAPAGPGSSSSNHSSSSSNSSSRRKGSSTPAGTTGGLDLNLGLLGGAPTTPTTAHQTLNPSSRPLSSCQLVSRTWVMRGPEGDPLGDPVGGEGVIGKFPILVPGKEEFVYQSCTNQEQGLGFMDGVFTFAEGSMMQPSGPSFDVLVPRMRLEVPEYFY